MYNNDAQRCLTGEVRLSYVNLDKPRQPQGGVGDAKYSATLLIPKTDTATIADFRAAIQAAAQIGAGTLWGGIIPPNLDSIIHDGDGVRPSGFQFPQLRVRYIAKITKAHCISAAQFVQLSVFASFIIEEV